jgi:hypothetical protein
MKINTLFAQAVIAAAVPMLVLATSHAATVSNTTNLGGGVSTSTACEVGTTGSASGGVNGNNVGGSASAGSGMSCTNTTGYSDPNGYIGLETTCSSGTYGNAQGTAGANGVMVCADASTGSSCSAALAGGGSSQYGGGGGSAGVGAGGEGVGYCGGVTFGNGVANIQMCGNLAFEVGVDVCINGSVNYGNIINRMEPFASRAVAQAAKCASSNTAAANCTFTAGDMLANAAGPYYKRTAVFFNANKQFVVGPAKAIWGDSKAIKYRSTNYAKSAGKFAGNKLTNTAYNAAGQVTNAAGQIVDVGNITKDAMASATSTVVAGATNVGNTVASGATNVGNTVASGATSVGKSVSSGLKKATKGW